METQQIYGIVNSVVNQGLGRTDLTVINNEGIISLGNTILNSNDNTEGFMNTLSQMITRDIISSREYRAKFAGLLRDDFEWGAIVRKIKISMPVAEADQSYDLVDGESVDHFKISKPKATQKLFVSRTPWQIHITVQRVHLKEAFTGESQMGAFISALYTEIQNMLTLSIEELGRNCHNNYIAEVSDKPSRVVNLVTLYNAAVSPDPVLTATTAMHDADFLRWAISQINIASDNMEEMSILYNDGTETRHTPRQYQNMFVLNTFQRALETVVQYSAFQEGYVSLMNYNLTSFFQDIKTPASILIERASDGTEVALNNIVATMFDIEALGSYKEDMWTSTTPFNSAGGYTNTYWHAQNLYFNDMSENFIVFTLN